MNYRSPISNSNICSRAYEIQDGGRRGKERLLTSKQAVLRAPLLSAPLQSIAVTSNVFGFPFFVSVVQSFLRKLRVKESKEAGDTTVYWCNSIINNQAIEHYLG